MGIIGGAESLNIGHQAARIVGDDIGNFNFITYFYLKGCAMGQGIRIPARTAWISRATRGW